MADVLPTIIISAVSAVFGGGGVAAIMKVLADRRQGIDTNEIAEDDALIKRWNQLSEAQITDLVQPLKEQLAEMKVDISNLKTENQEMRARIELSTRKYWRAVQYIRALYAHYARHAPEVLAPEPPAELVADI